MQKKMKEKNLDFISSTDDCLVIVLEKNLSVVSFVNLFIY